MRIVLHAGHFKTGTTSFQQTLDRHRDALGSAGVYVPEMPRGNHGYALGTVAYADGPESALRADLERAAAAGYRACILSAEVISHFGEPAFGRLARFLAPYRVSFVLVVRHWYTFLPARYAQNVRRCDCLGLRPYLARIVEDERHHPDVNFGLIIRRAAKHFAEVHVAPYAEHSAANAVFPLLGLPEAQIEAMTAGAPRANVSPPGTFIEALRLVNCVLCEALGLPPDQKHRQAGDWGTPIRKLDCSDRLRDLQRAGAPLYAQLVEAADRRASTLDLGELRADSERWLEVFMSSMRACGAVGEPGDAFLATAPPAIAASDATEADLSPALRNAVLREFRAADRTQERRTIHRPD